MIENTKIVSAFGDIFETAADLLVIPTNVNGDMSPAFEKGLTKERINTRPDKGDLGTISRPQILKSNKFRHLIFAYSVNPKVNSKTLPEHIQSIGKSLGELSQKLKAKKIVAPLLGSGAGGMNPVEAFDALATGFQETSPDFARLTIVINDENFFRALQNQPQTRRKLSGISKSKDDKDFQNQGMAYKGLLGYIYQHQPIELSQFSELRWFYLLNPEDHFYTVDSSQERFNNRNRSDRGIVGFVNSKEDLSTIALHRFVHAVDADHLFLTSPNFDLIKHLGYREESSQKIFLYGKQMDDTVPIYFYSTRNEELFTPLAEDSPSLNKENAIVDQTTNEIKKDFPKNERKKETSREFYPYLKAEGNHDDTEDQLQFTNDINSFATVISLKSVRPPLAIGLFGNWGSGKSFFMQKLSARIKRLTDPKNNSPDYVHKVVQVKFNSWHYSDANLWASLITEIFDSLKAYTLDNGEGDELKKLTETLQITNIQKEAAQYRTKELEAHIEQMTLEKEEKRKRLEDISGINLLRFVLKNSNVKSDLYNLTNENVQKIITDTAELANYVKKVKSAGQKYMWHFGFIKNFKGKNWFIVFAIMVLIFAITYVVKNYYNTEWQNLTLWLATLLGGITAFIANAAKIIAPFKKGMDNFFERLDSIKKDLEARAYEIPPRLRKEIDELTGLKKSMEQLDAKMQETQKEINDIHTGRKLLEFIELRSRDENYSRQLGLISWIRKDFSKLDDLLRKQYDATESKSVQNPQNVQLRIDRIVLYIDDLDRCSESTVVKVLEAIHLLLAFPLFVVIVGVDPRWLSNALNEKYRTLFGINMANGNGRNSENEEMLKAGAATTYDYLEKIFQITFCIKPIGKAGRESLIDYLLKNEMLITTDENVVTKKSLLNIKDDEPTATNVLQPTPGPKLESDISIDPVSNHVHNAGGPKKNESIENQNQPEEKRTPLTFTKEELDFMKLVSVMFGNTPRTVNRYVNIYRIIKSHKSLDVTDDYNDDDYIPTMFILSIVVGYSQYANAYLEVLKVKDDDMTMGEFMNSSDHPGQLLPFILNEIRNAIAPLPMKHFKRNVDLIGRFSFRAFAK
jgi:hypothetical protein